MSTIVIMPGGFHPFHAGHMALYNSALGAFPGAEVYVAATDDTSERPFPFQIKSRLARLAGVPAGHFVRVKSPFRAEEITSRYNPKKDVLIFVRSEKDAGSQPKPGGIKKDGSPSYLQPLQGNENNLQPFGKHAYMAYLPTVEFTGGMTSASEIRAAWPKLNDKRKLALVMSLYPRTQSNPALAANVVKLINAGMGLGLTGLAEAGRNDNDHPNRRDAELNKTLQYARGHYAGVGDDPDLAFKKWVQRSLKHSEEDDVKLDNTVRKLANRVSGLEQDLVNLQAKSLEETMPVVGGQVASYQSQDNPQPQPEAVEAFGFAYNRRDQRVTWRKVFPSVEAAQQWADSKNATIMDVRPAPQPLEEFASDDFDNRPKFIPWPDFIEGVKGIVGNDFSVTEKVIKSTIQDRFIPHDPMEFGPTMLYSYYEARAGRNKGAVSTRGSIQVGKYVPNTSQLGKQNFITSFNLLKGHPFERHFDLTPENISKIASIILGNTEGAYQMQSVDEDYVDER